MDSRAPLDTDQLTAVLTAPSRLWNRVVVTESTASTNADAADAARDGAAEGLVVTTEQQVAGRGRLDRSWQTVPGAAIAVSVVLRPTVPPASWVWLPLLTGLAVNAAARRCGVASTLKWPNDALVDGRKFAGILLERVDGPAGPAAVIGVGLNVSLNWDELPVPTATSLVLEGSTVTDRITVIDLLLDELERRYRSWIAAGGDVAELRAEYLQRCGTIGQVVRVELPDGSDLVGRAESIDEHGRLVVDGQPVSAGDVTHVRSV